MATYITPTIVRIAGKNYSPALTTKLIQVSAISSVDSTVNTPITISAIAITTGLATTSAANTLNVGDKIVFTALAGGVGVTPNITYYVISIGSSTTFNFAATPGGAAVVPTTAYTGTTMYKISAKNAIPVLASSVITLNESTSVWPVKIYCVETASALLTLINA